MTDWPPSSPSHHPSQGKPEPKCLSLCHGAEMWSTSSKARQHPWGPSGQRERARARAWSFPTGLPAGSGPSLGSPPPQVGLSNTSLPTSTSLPRNLPQPPAPCGDTAPEADLQTQLRRAKPDSQKGKSPRPSPLQRNSGSQGPISSSLSISLRFLQLGTERILRRLLPWKWIHGPLENTKC